MEPIEFEQVKVEEMHDVAMTDERLVPTQSAWTTRALFVACLPCALVHQVYKIVCCIKS